MSLIQGTKEEIIIKLENQISHEEIEHYISTFNYEKEKFSSFEIENIKNGDNQSKQDNEICEIKSNSVDIPHKSEKESEFNIDYLESNNLFYKHQDKSDDEENINQIKNNNLNHNAICKEHKPETLISDNVTINLSYPDESENIMIAETLKLEIEVPKLIESVLPHLDDKQDLSRIKEFLHKTPLERPIEDLNVDDIGKELEAELERELIEKNNNLNFKCDDKIEPEKENKIEVFEDQSNVQIKNYNLITGTTTDLKNENNYISDSIRTSVLKLKNGDEILLNTNITPGTHVHEINYESKNRNKMRTMISNKRNRDKKEENIMNLQFQGNKDEDILEKETEKDNVRRTRDKDREIVIQKSNGVDVACKEIQSKEQKKNEIKNVNKINSKTLTCSELKPKIKISLADYSDTDILNEKNMRSLNCEIIVDDNDFDILLSNKLHKKICILLAINLRKPILSIKWLEDSLAQKKVMPYDKYYLKDQKIENKYNLDLRHLLTDTPYAFYLENYKIYVTDHVPLKDDIEELIFSAGGKVLSVLPKSVKKNQNLIIIADRQNDRDEIKKYKLNKFESIYDVDLILDSVFVQNLELNKSKYKI